tara:strand:- start:67 stop:225 length:159 start_codon:yes stop_codon:yes gene_type:complete
MPGGQQGDWMPLVVVVQDLVVLFGQSKAQRDAVASRQAMPLPSELAWVGDHC